MSGWGEVSMVTQHVLIRGSQRDTSTCEGIAAAMMLLGGR